MYILLCNATLRRIIHVKCVPKAPIEPLCIIQGPFLLHRQSFPNFPSAYTIRGKGRVVVLVVDGREIKRMRFFVVRGREPPPPPHYYTNPTNTGDLSDISEESLRYFVVKAVALVSIMPDPYLSFLPSMGGGVQIPARMLPRPYWSGIQAGCERKRGGKEKKKWKA